MDQDSPRGFTAHELDFINFLKTNGATYKRMDELLCTFYLTEEQGRGLIVQAKDHYVVLFLTLALFEDEEKKKEELERFFELLGLIRWLKDTRYICLFRNHGAADKVMYFLQDGFRHAQQSGNKILLNAKGEYTAAPDTIHDKNGAVIYKGIILDNDYFDMVVNSLTGNLYVLPEISALQQLSAVAARPAKQEILNAEDAEAVPAKRPLNRSLTFMAVFGTILLLVLVVIGIHSVKKYEEMRGTLDKIVDLNSKQIAVAASGTTISAPQSGVVKTVDSLEYLYGIDISHWDGNIMEDIKKIDSLSFAICKATEGSVGVDPDFKTNWELIKNKGLVRGSYHFFRTSEDAAEQAAHFFKTAIKELGPTDIPPIVDIEELSIPKGVVADKKDVQDKLLGFLQRLEKLSGRTPMIYTDCNFASLYLHDKSLAKYPLWLADYTKSAKPKIPEVWEKDGYKIWQRSDAVHIASFTTDYDVYYGTREGLTKPINTP